MDPRDTCPPLYIPTRSECLAAMAQSRQELLEAGLDPARWDFDGMTCSHGERPGSHIEDVPGSGLGDATGP